MKKIATVLYYVMLWIRPVFLGLSRLIQLLFTGAFVFMVGFNLLVDDANSWWIVLPWGLLAFGIFMLREYYDRILLRLKPDEIDVILFK
jgi:hypothetical protein